MSFKEFGPNDIILNTMKTHPLSEFFIFDSVIYYNNEKHLSGAFSANTKNVPPGFISLYEYNIDKISGSNVGETLAGHQPGNNFIYPWIYKDSNRVALRNSVSTSPSYQFTVDAVGDKLYGGYPLSASITRELMGNADTVAPANGAGEQGSDFLTSSAGCILKQWKATPIYPHYWALKNALNYYGVQSKHYKVTGSWTGNGQVPRGHSISLPENTTYEWVKDQQVINLISIPEIFYGSKIKPGSLSLKWYFTGSLIGELQDTKRNGELIQVNTSGNPALADNSGSVAGVVLYNEGFILLTGSWALNTEAIPLIVDSTTTKNPAWIYFGAGAQDGVTQTSTADSGATSDYMSASFNLSFKGTTETQVITMFAHAERGMVNYSNNPTFLKYGQEELKVTSSQVYEENPDRLIANTVSSSYTDYSASFKRQVYVSRVAIYDDSKNLIGLATLACPVLKEEDQDLTFKIRLDI
jgi:hypothetical protein